MWPFPFRRHAMYDLEHQGSRWISKQKNREFKLKYLKRFFDADNIGCLQEVHGKDEYFQAIQVVGPRFRFFLWILLCLITKTREDRLSAFTGTFFFLKRLLWYIFLLVTAVVTLWTFNLGDGVLLGDFNVCDPEGRFNVWNQTVTDGDPWKIAVFHSFFYTSLRLLNLIPRGGSPQPLGSYALFQGLIVFDQGRDFQCCSHVFENLGKRTIPSAHAAVPFAIQKPANRGHQSKRIPSWMSKNPVFCSFVAAVSRRLQVLSWPVLCTCRVWGSSQEDEEADESWVLTTHQTVLERSS